MRTSGPVVILVHGTGDRAASFDDVVELLEDVAVERYDRRGWALGATTTAASTIEEHADDLLEVVAGRRVVLVGHSWGGNVVLAACIRCPSVVLAAGVYETSMAWAPWWGASHRAHLTGVVERARNRTNGSEQQRRERALFVGEVAQTLTRPYDLADLRVRCLIGYGTASLPGFAQGMQRLAREVGGDCHALAGAGHMAHRDDPEGFATFVRRVVRLAGQG